LQLIKIGNFRENISERKTICIQNGAFTKDGLKSVQEITIAKIMIQNLGEYCIRKQKEFRIWA